MLCEHGLWQGIKKVRIEAFEILLWRKVERIKCIDRLRNGGVLCLTSVNKSIEKGEKSVYNSEL